MKVETQRASLMWDNLPEAEMSFLMAHPKQSVHPRTVHTWPREMHLACFIHVFVHTTSHTSKMNDSEGKD